MTKHGAVPVVGRSHVTATKFAFFAEERPTKKLQDPGLSVPGIPAQIRSKALAFTARTLQAGMYIFLLMRVSRNDLGTTVITILTDSFRNVIA